MALKAHIYYRKHARERMIERQVSALDVDHLLKSSPVVRVEPHQRETRWNVRGRDLDGREIEVVVVVIEDAIEIHVVTVIEK